MQYIKSLFMMSHAQIIYCFFFRCHGKSWFYGNCPRPSSPPFKRMFQCSGRSTPSLGGHDIPNILQNNGYRSMLSNSSMTLPELNIGPLAMKMACIDSRSLSYPCTPYPCCESFLTEANEQNEIIPSIFRENIVDYL